jgi:hypothetical protein
LWRDTLTRIDWHISSPPSNFLFKAAILPRRFQAVKNSLTRPPAGHRRGRRGTILAIGG